MSSIEVHKAAYMILLVIIKDDSVLQQFDWDNVVSGIENSLKNAKFKTQIL